MLDSIAVSLFTNRERRQCYLLCACKLVLCRFDLAGQLCFNPQKEYFIIYLETEEIAEKRHSVKCGRAGGKEAFIVFHRSKAAIINFMQPMNKINTLLRQRIVSGVSNILMNKEGQLYSVDLEFEWIAFTW